MIGWGETAATSVTPEEFFAGYPESLQLFEVLHAALEAPGPVEMRVSKSQIAFRGKRAFAWAWIPDRYLGGGHAPLVLSLAFRERRESQRWKQVVEPAPGRFMHHLELRSAQDIDDEVRGWIRDAWEAAL